MAKKVTINGSNIISSLSDAWGGTNNSSSAQTIHGTSVPAGAEWGINRGEVERFVKAQMSSQQTMTGYYTCATAAATAAKTVAATGYALTAGGCIRIKMNNANTANNVTLNINSTGAKALHYLGSQASSSNSWEAGDVLEVFYDGVKFQCAGWEGDKFSTGEKVRNTAITDEVTENSEAIVTSGAVAEETNCLKASVGYYECNTAAITPAKTVSASGYKLTTGGNIRIKMANANSVANATLNINSTGDIPFYYGDAQASATNTWEAGEVLEVYYDGTKYQSRSGKNQGMGEDDEYVISKAFNSFDKRLEKVENSYIGEDEEYVIAQALTNLKQNGGGGSHEETSDIESMSLSDSDVIEVVSSSYGAGNHEVQGKNWVAKIGLFTDYRIVNNSWDGANNIAHIKSLRQGGKNSSKYALCVCNENNSGMSDEVKMRDIENLCRTYVGMGVTPIVGTQYNSPSRNLSMGFYHYAKKNNFPFADMRYYCRSILSTMGISKFDLGTHLGTRNATAMSDFYSRIIGFLPRPEKSMKIFKLRNGYSTDNLDELVFTTNEQRARIFKELNFVSWGLTDPTTVDDRPNPGSTYPNEYSQMDNNGVTFSNAALVSAVLPYTSHNLKKVSLSASISGEVSVYVRNVTAQPYPVAATYVRFTVMDSGVSAPSQNDVYSDGTNSFTVYMTVPNENGSNFTLYCTGTFDQGDPQTGNLTKSSGSGPSTIPYSLREQVTMGGSDVTLADNNGHWVEIPKVNGEYDASSRIINSVDIDKVHFLVVGSSFMMARPKINYSGKGSKVYQYTFEEFRYNDDNPNDELIQESTFGSAGTPLEHWVDGSNNAITPVLNYEDANHYWGGSYSSCHPDGCPSVVNVTDSYAMKQSISSSVTRVAPLTLEVWCRYFPQVYTDGSANQITLDSFDYNTLKVKVGSTSMEQLVSTAWGKYQFRINDIKGLATADQYIRLSAANSYGVQICKVSLKYEI